ncbi:hypothetical protein NEHOM01_0904 [Nematocida homosporus]|uniref:uncharacterized protein n=1 Tax=Nematocida homosporus TaxID=1912981 RepID=UPI002220A453|nr:uncharacterized protein NEHOM01_0904 [Nematocida homosporus]KAI5185545.1 hypothetical protein NEHOM01_0904 [Nematocida homosporus]
MRFNGEMMGYMEAYLKEIKIWRLLSEWKRETIIGTLQMNSRCREWFYLVQLALGRTALDQEVDRYSSGMYTLLKNRAKALGYSVAEISNIQRVEARLTRRFWSLYLEWAPVILRETTRTKQYLHAKSSIDLPYLHELRTPLSDYLIERVLVQTLPANVRVYFIGPTQSTLIIWLAQKDPFGLPRLKYLQRTIRVVVLVENEQTLTWAQLATLRGIFGQAVVQKKMVLPRIELGLRDSKSRVLPLHHRTS